MASAQTGKRYTCPKCGSEFIVTKGGDGELMCGDTPLELKK
ncbi:MAG: desulfoferrodoxin [Dehalococcoidia bacterium]|jgi:rubredoxin|nr:desulfoferrodoxin [Dehalococcoidia bacterium]MCA9824157.1 desulfoferrodoxin [Dehalococcoidia bacterium]MCA9855118.1 desulfoferrodoxin [Dehalococcoidia bacterium]